MLKKKINLLATLLLAITCASCSQAVLKNDETFQSKHVLKIVNWNVETFFDSVTTGNEYDEFVSSKNWGHESYVERLKRLSSVIQNLDADIFVMEEVENEGVLYDLYNFLSAQWDFKKLYPYACFAKDEGSSIGCGLLSRYPLEDMTVHSLDVRTESEQMPKMRPLMQVRICVGEEKFTLFVSHWKSMLGGESSTEKWRLWQESVLSSEISSCVRRGMPCLSCGDFNRDIHSFAGGKTKGSVLLRNKFSGGCEVQSGWYLSDGSMVSPGSYWYDGWSRIDNFFAGGRAFIVSLSCETDGPWYDSESDCPFAYRIWSGNGYSDHLPVTCIVSF